MTPQISLVVTASRGSLAALTAATIAEYPVQRQRLPARAVRMSRSDGAGLAISERFGRHEHAGVQYPHCTAPCSMNFPCSTSSCPFFARPSTVIISLPRACTARTQEFTALPSNMTVQAPQHRPQHIPPWYRSGQAGCAAHPKSGRRSRLDFVARTIYSQHELHTAILSP